MTTAVLSRDATIRKLDKRIAELRACYLRILDKASPGDHARLWRQIDALLDKRLELREPA